MGLFSWIRRALGGEGTARFEFKTDDGCHGSVKISYEGDFWSVPMEKHHNRVRNWLLVHEGIVATHVNLVGIIED